MTPIAQLLRNLGSVRLVITLAVVAAGIGILVFIATRLVEPPMALLYSGLEPRDAGQIVSRLETANVPYELRAGGSQIYVPSDAVLRLRMTLAQDGLPRGGTVGYEVFDQPDSFGATRDLRDINYLRALEGELARTIGALAQIRGARVHLVIPRRELFTRDREAPSASIVVDVAGGDTLSKAEVAAIQHLVASAVAGLKPARVSVIDTKGVLLARGDGEEAASLASAASAEYKVGLENRLKTQIEGLLERSVGFGKVRAEVTAEVDFDRVATNEEIYDPDGQVARSTQVVEEKASATDTSPSDAVTVGNALPDAEAPSAAGPTSTNATDRVEETTNFEISKTVRSHVQEGGRIKRLSVAVMVDGSYTTDENGQQVYTPRSEEEMARLAALVRTAIGYDEDRGDRVEIVNLPFVRVETPAPETEPMLALGKSDYFKIAEIAVLLVVGLLVVLLVLRPLATHALVVQPAEAGSGDAKALPSPEQPEGAERKALEGGEGEDESMIDLDRIEGKVKESSLRKINEIVENHPEEALAIVRNWLYQGS